MDNKEKTHEERFPDWEELYERKDVEEMPWYVKTLDPDILEALNSEIPKPQTILDLGTGPGTQAIELAKLGYQVTATDISKPAIEKARQLAEDCGVENIHFLCDDILNSKLTDQFDCIIDRGCFHVLEPKDRVAYVQKIPALLKQAGLFLLKTFSKLEKRPIGPYTFDEDDIKNLFKNYLTSVSFKSSLYYGTIKKEPQAVFSILRKIN